MQRLLITLSIALSISLLALSANAQVKDAIGIWLFDEGKGNVVKDLSGNGNDGTFVVGGDFVDGKFGKAVKFNGVNQCIEVPHSDSLNIDGDQVTILCWFYWEGSGDAWQTFVSKGPMSGTNENWAYFINSGGTYTHFVITPNGVRQTINSPGGAFKPKEWNFTAGTYDGKRVRIYMNGKLVTDQPMTGKLTPNKNTLRIGHREGSSHWWNGMLDEIGVFRRALSEDEINDIMNNGLSKQFLAVSSKNELPIAWGYIKSR